MKFGALTAIGIALLLSPLAAAEAHHARSTVVVTVVHVPRSPGANVLLDVSRFALRGTGFTVNDGIVPPLLRPTIPVSVPGLRFVSFAGSPVFVDHGNIGTHSKIVVLSDAVIPAGQVAVVRGTSVSFVSVATD